MTSATAELRDGVTEAVRVVSERNWRASSVDDARRVMNLLHVERFTGKITIHMSQGGVAALISEEQQKLVP